MLFTNPCQPPHCPNPLSHSLVSTLHPSTTPQCVHSSSSASRPCLLHHPLPQKGFDTRRPQQLSHSKTLIHFNPRTQPSLPPSQPHSSTTQVLELKPDVSRPPPVRKMKVGLKTFLSRIDSSSRRGLDPCLSKWYIGRSVGRSVHRSVDC